MCFSNRRSSQSSFTSACELAISTDRVGNSSRNSGPYFCASRIIDCTGAEGSISGMLPTTGQVRGCGIEEGAISWGIEGLRSECL